MLLIFIVQCCFATQFYIQNWISYEVKLSKKKLYSALYPNVLHSSLLIIASKT